MNPLVEFGVGVLLQGGASFADAPTPDTFLLPRAEERAQQSSLSAPTFGAGLTAELRYARRLGLELGATYFRTRLSGEVDGETREVDVSLRQDELHVPLMLKGYFPLDAFTGFVGLGVEHAVPGLPSAQSEPTRGIPVAATAEPYWNFLASAGLELDASVGGWDLRVPLGVRFSYQLGFDDSLPERVRVLPSDALIYTSTPRFGLHATAGLVFFP
jgi:hypothetical protein